MTTLEFQKKKKKRKEKKKKNIELSFALDMNRFKIASLFFKFSFSQPKEKTSNVWE